MSYIEENLRKAILAPLRAREHSLTYAKLFGELFDELAEALRSRQWRFDLPSDLAASKERLINHLEQAGEAKYQALVCQQALELLERHPGDTAEEAIAVVESAMLEAAIGHDE